MTFPRLFFLLESNGPEKMPEASIIFALLRGIFLFSWKPCRLMVRNTLSPYPGVSLFSFALLITWSLSPEVTIFLQFWETFLCHIFILSALIQVLHSHGLKN